jgi:DNA polymerase I-like protein with 3'-5' exonuclease and polymerase domains
MILQVHDELVFEAPEKELATLSTLVRQEMSSAMSSAIKLDVPIKVDIGVRGELAVGEFMVIHVRFCVSTG